MHCNYQQLPPRRLNKLHDIAKWIQTIGTIGAIILLIIYLLIPGWGRAMHRWVNIDRHWFKVGYYNMENSSWVKEDGTPNTPLVESGAGSLKAKFKDSWFWGQTFNHGEVVIPSNDGGAVGHSEANLTKSAVTGRASRSSDCIYVQDSQIRPGSNVNIKEI